ncbi:MAG: tetratricopeptide repeat protein [Gemmatimonadaceae bacterium]
MRTRSLISASLGVALLAACATGGVGTGQASPEAIVRLEKQQTASPTSAAVNRALGIAYYQAKRYPEARSALETAARLDPKDGTTALFLGLTAEAQNDLPTARRAYSSYLEHGRTSRVRAQLQFRLAALARRELEADAKLAVKQEAAIGNVAGSPRTIAVFPLRFTGADSSLKPLERGFADLLITDLARSSQLTLVERARLQALLDEMALQQGGATDAATNVRAGRLMRAGRLVQGALLQLDPTQLRADAAVVNVPTTQVQGVAQGASPLDQVFDLEKRIALDLFRELGVTLTVAERNAVEQRPTRSLAAFVAYSRGLTADDEGRYDDAARYFSDAVRLDPGFGAAQQKGEEARAASAGSAVTAQTIQTSLRGTSEGAAAAAAAQGSISSAGSLGSTIQSAANGLNTSAASDATAGASIGVATPPSIVPTKEAVSVGLGADGVTQIGTITIQLPRPKIP